MSDTKKLNFLILLRGIAVGIVIPFHLVICGLVRLVDATNDGFISYTDGNYTLLNAIDNTFNFGSLGVGIFFLISGFVIPISLEKYKPKIFLIHRFFRLYPTLIVSAILYWFFVVYIYSNMTGITGYNYNLFRILFAQLIDKCTNFNVLDGVLWTLKIEWKFYFYSAIIFGILSIVSKKYIKKNTHLFDRFSLIHLSILYLLINNIHFSMLLFGLLSFLFFKKRINKYIFALINISFFIKLSYGRSYEYIACCIIWYLAYYYKDKINHNKIIFFLADISYPLYLIHPLGYFIISYAVSLNINIIISILVAMIFSIILSFLITKFIEKPFINIGKKINNC